MSIETKEIRIQEKADGKVLEVHISGKLEKQDYEKFVPTVESLIKQHGKIRVLVYLHEFAGWTAGALWEDLWFDWKHFRDIQRLVIVGESTWEHGMALFCKPFTRARIKYFEHSQLVEARRWIESDEV